MPLFNFGSGLLYARPLVGNAPPQIFGTLQDVGVEMSSDEKMLYGSYDFPDIAVNGRSKIAIKAKFGQVSAGLFNALYYGGTQTAGLKLLVLAESGTVPAATTYTITVSKASGAGIVANSVVDYGVRYANGNPLTFLATGTPVQGQYTVTIAGVYTFAAADASANVFISYSYTSSATLDGQTFTRNQQLIGTTIFFGMFLYNAFNGVQNNLEFFKCKCSKLSRSTKNDDFTVPEMDITVIGPNAATGAVFAEYAASF